MARKIQLINPFVQSLDIKCRWTIKNTHSQSGFNVTGVPLEVDHRVSVYTDGLMDLLTSMDKSTLKLFAYICAHLRWGQDYLQLDQVKVCEELGIARSTFYSAVGQLTNVLIVKRETSYSTYFINPKYIYCGKRHLDYQDRVTFINSNPLAKLFEEPDQQADSPVTVVGTDWPISSAEPAV